MNKLNQKQKIVAYLEKHDSLTTFEAFTELGITKLPTRISELIRDGYRFEKKMVKSLNRDGESCEFMRYRLIGYPVREC